MGKPLSRNKMVKNVKQPATEQKEASNKRGADLEVKSLATVMNWLLQSLNYIITQ